MSSLHRIQKMAGHEETALLHLFKKKNDDVRTHAWFKGMSKEKQDAYLKMHNHQPKSKPEEYAKHDYLSDFHDHEAWKEGGGNTSHYRAHTDRMRHHHREAQEIRRHHLNSVPQHHRNQEDNRLFHATRDLSQHVGLAHLGRGPHMSSLLKLHEITAGNVRNAVWFKAMSKEKQEEYLKLHSGRGENRRGRLAHFHRNQQEHHEKKARDRSTWKYGKAKGDGSQGAGPGPENEKHARLAAHHKKLRNHYRL